MAQKRGLKLVEGDVAGHMIDQGGKVHSRVKLVGIEWGGQIRLDRRGLRVAGPRLAMRDDPATKLKTPRNQAESKRVNDAPHLAKLEFSTQGRQTYPSISPETF